jgi:hypothetical protein
MAFLKGCVSIIGGRLSQSLLGRLGPIEYTTLANSCSVLQLCLKGVAGSVGVVGLATGVAGAAAPQGIEGASLFSYPPNVYIMWLALLPAILGNQEAKNTAVRSMETQQAIDAGMDKGEQAAAHANVNALVKFLAPQLYGALYQYAARARAQGVDGAQALLPKRQMVLLQGLPYFVAAAVMGLVQLLLWRVKHVEGGNGIRGASSSSSGSSVGGACGGGVGTSEIIPGLSRQFQIERTKAAEMKSEKNTRRNKAKREARKRLKAANTSTTDTSKEYTDVQQGGSTSTDASDTEAAVDEDSDDVDALVDNVYA